MEPVILSEEQKAHLRAVRDLMRANLTRIDMDLFVAQQPLEEGIPEEACGTVGCIAGYVNLYNGFTEEFQNSTLCEAFKELPAGATKVDLSTIFMEDDLANALLGLNGAETERLFYIEDWAEPFRSEIDRFRLHPIRLRNARAYGEIVIRRLEHFIETGL